MIKTSPGTSAGRADTISEPMSPPEPRSTVARMAGYTPGEQPQPGAKVIKLNTNENPYPPSPKVFDAIRSVAADSLRRYPQPMADDFRRVAARHHGVTPAHILAGNGSDDILQIALRSYCGPGDVLASPDPTYSLYPVLAELADVRYVTVPWGPGWSPAGHSSGEAEARRSGARRQTGTGCRRPAAIPASRTAPGRLQHHRGGRQLERSLAKGSRSLQPACRRRTRRPRSIRPKYLRCNQPGPCSRRARA